MFTAYVWEKEKKKSDQKKPPNQKTPMGGGKLLFSRVNGTSRKACLLQTGSLLRPKASKYLSNAK